MFYSILYLKIRLYSFNNSYFINYYIAIKLHFIKNIFIFVILLRIFILLYMTRLQSNIKIDIKIFSSQTKGHGKKKDVTFETIAVAAGCLKGISATLLEMHSKI